MSSNTGTPNKSIRSRMGGVMRRTSSILSVGRPSTPSPASTPAHLPDDSRRSSVSQLHEGRRSTTSLTPSAGPAVSLPPPEPQLPAITVDPQPLEVEHPPPAAPAPGPEVTEASSTPAPPAPPASTADAAPTPTPTPAPPANGSSLPKAVKRLLPIAQQYQMYPSPITESPVREAAASTEERPAEEAPPAPAVEERPAPSQAEPAAVPAASVVEVQPPPPTSTYVPPPLVLDSSNPGAYTDEPEEMMTPLARTATAPAPVVAPVVVVEEAAAPIPEVPAPQTIAEPIPEAAPAPAPAPAAPSPALDDPGYFDLMHPALLQPIVSPASGISDTTVTVMGDHAAPALDLSVEPYPYGGAEEPESQPQPQSQSQVQEDATATVSAPGVVGIQIVDPDPSKIPVARTEEDDALARAEAETRVWEEAEAEGWVEHDDEDPFADPPQEQSRREEENVGFSIPVIAVQKDDDGDVGGGPIPRSVRTGLSTENISGRFQVSEEPVTDERRPLLSAEAPSYGPANAGDASVPGLSFRDLGWIEYSLPARTVTYYVHPTLRVTTDFDLRKADALSRVGRALGYEGGGPRAGSMGRARMEMWLRDTGVVKGKGKEKGKGSGHKHAKGKGKWREDLAELGLAKWWVDHVKREVSSGEDVLGLEDHMDMEYRYWAFMESHPAHAALPFNAKREAMDLLSWSWTDRLLAPHAQSLPPPFTQNECQELLGLLRSFGDMPQPDTDIQSVVSTRVVSRIILRAVRWRQQHFRPHKALPIDAAEKPRSLGFFRTTAQILVSVLLLGVPYLFSTRRPRADAEGGHNSSSTGAEARSILPFLVVGASTCLLAALLLSALVTFLTLPGLDGRARAVALAAGCMVSGLVALFRYKAEMADSAPPTVTTHAMMHHHYYMGSPMGREGLTLISTRSVVMSLPLVLLIYALLGFVAAIVVYSFSGNQSGVRFEDYTRWAVLGVLGGVAGVLATSLVLLRR